MRYFNLFYLFVFLTGIALWRLNATFSQDIVSFYGFAENKETEINFNYPVAVGAIYVQPGQRVKAGEKLLDMYRIKPKERLSDEPFRIAELSAKERVWANEKAGDLQEAENKQRQAIAEMDTKISELKAEKAFQEKLYEGLTTIEKKDYTPFTNKIASLEREKKLLQTNFEQTKANIEKQLQLGKNPYRLERERLQAEQNFAKANIKVEIPLLAPHDGVVGNLYCKEGEHMESFETLVSFYEPNPSLVEGYVQEDLILHVAINDSFKIRSTKDATLNVYGKVTGLGSRIVEIPERLRKIPDMKTYGREILVSIPADNNFLQKEKVILEFVHAPDNLRPTVQKKPLTDLEIKQ